MSKSTKQTKVQGLIN